jgi:predicted dehydrogenase
MTQIMGGGALMDDGIHVLDLVRYVMATSSKRSDTSPPLYGGSRRRTMP